MTKTFIAALNGREVSFSSINRTYTHAAVRARADGSLSLVARFGRPDLAKKFRPEDVIVLVTEGDLSPQGEIDAIEHGPLASARESANYHIKQRAKINALVAAGVKPDANGWFRDGDHTIMSIETCDKRLADESAAIQRLEKRVAFLRTKIDSEAADRIIALATAEPHREPEQSSAPRERRIEAAARTVVAEAIKDGRIISPVIAAAIGELRRALED